MNNKPKKIIFVKNSAGNLKQAYDLDMYLSQRQNGKAINSKLQDAQFLVGIPKSAKSQYRKNCCGRKS